MEVVEFGKEDMFCNTLTSWTVTDSNTGETIGGGHMRQWRDDLEWGAVETKYVSTLGTSAQVDALFHSLKFRARF